MATIQVAKLIVPIVADTARFAKGLAGAAKQATSWAGGVAKTVGKVGFKALTRGAVVAAGATAGLGAALFKLAADAAPLENVQRAFEGILGAAGGPQWRGFLTAMEEASAGMVSQRDLMTSFNKAAQLVSDDFAMQLPDAMQYLSKVSAATGTDMNYLLDSLVIGVGRLSPRILDNLGIQVKLSEATDKAAGMFGKQAEELTNAEQQAGLMAVVMEKLQANTAAMPDVSDSAAAGFARIGAQMQNLKDQIGLAVLPVIAPLLDNLSSLAQEYGPQVVQMFTDFAAKLNEVLPPAAMLIGDAFSRIGVALGLVSEDATGADVVIAVLKATLDAAVIGVQAFAVTMQAVATAVEWVTEKVREAIEVLNQLNAIATAGGGQFELGGRGVMGGGAGGTSLAERVFGSREFGGPVAADVPYIVGEAGPELFTPSQSGEIMPGGGTQVIQLVVDSKVLAEVTAPHLGRMAARRAGMATL